MRKRLRIGLAILAVCAFGVTGLYLLHPREPFYEGRRFSEWVLIMHSKEPGPEQEEARAVVRQLGSNSIPLLLHWLRERDGATLTERLSEAKYKVMDWLVARRIIKPRPISMTILGPNHRTIASWALPELDPAIKKAVVPVLISMLGDKSHKPDEISETAGRTYLVLSTMAPESIGPLIEALSSQDVQVAALASGALGNIGPAAKAAIPVLKYRLKNKDPNVRIGAAETIGKLGGEPDEFVPVLIQSLPELKWDYISYDLDILVRFKEHAKPAVPVLLTILNNYPESTNASNIILRSEIKSALREIDPVAAAGVGVQ